jgi:hypothetical protein
LFRRPPVPAAAPEIFAAGKDIGSPGSRCKHGLAAGCFENPIENHLKPILWDDLPKAIKKGPRIQSKDLLILHLPFILAVYVCSGNRHLIIQKITL